MIRAEGWVLEEEEEKPTGSFLLAVSRVNSINRHSDGDSALDLVAFITR